MATDHADHGSRGSTGVIVAAVSTSIAFVALSLRLMTRAFIVRNVGPEDYVVLVAFALSVALTALICVEVQHGQGRHYSTVSPEELEQLNKVSLPERFPWKLTDLSQGILGQCSCLPSQLDVD